MTTYSETKNPNNVRRLGPIQQLIWFISGAYSFIMLAYLILRLILRDEVWGLALLNAFAVYTFAPLLILLPLCILVRIWRMVIRLGFLALLGVIWFGPFFQPVTIDATDNPTLTIATFNLEVDRGGFTENVDAFGAWLDANNVDVVVFQETPNSLLDEGFPTLTETYTYVPQSDLRREGLRKSLLTRYPTQPAEQNEIYQRVVIEFEGQQIALYNVHFAWPFLDEPRFDIDTGSGWLNLLLKYDEADRNDQLEAFLDVIEAEELPYIVAGDFNTSQHSIIYSALAVEMEDSYRVASSGLGATWPTDRYGPLVPPLLRIDYVWYDDDAFQAVRSEVGPEFGSDHLPLFAQLELLPTSEDE